jgi:hypothetical protein
MEIYGHKEISRKEFLAELKEYFPTVEISSPTDIIILLYFFEES